MSFARLVLNLDAARSETTDSKPLRRIYARLRRFIW